MATPNISIRLEVLPGETVAEQITRAADFGFDAIALPGRFLDRWLAELRECRADVPLPMASISLGFVHSLLSPNESDRQECRDSLLRLLDLCAELEAPRLNVPPCLIQDNPVRIREVGDYRSLSERLDAILLEELPAIGDAAAERGVTFLLEPVNKYESEYLNSVVHAARLIRRLDHPAVQVTADFFHMQLEELHTAAALQESVSEVGHVHVAD
ncbi:MAG: sugar phosphate isomerase/epimerase family protein, partial [Limisphaerales bacterium]